MTNTQNISANTTGLGSAIMSRPYLLLVLAPMFWGGNVVAGKLAVGQIDPYLLLLGRWTGATLVLLMIALPSARRDWPVLRKNLPLLILYGIFGYAAFNILMYQAAHFTAAVNASIEQAAIPVIVLLGNFLIFRVRARPMQILGLLLTIFGVVWVASHGDPGRILSLSVNIGDGMVLLACLLYALYSLGLRYRPAVNWLSFLLITAAAALVTSLIFQLVLGGGFDRLTTEIPNATLLGWTCVIYTMIFPSILAQMFYARGVQLVGPNRASIFINLLPVFGTILSVLIIGESLQPYHLLAALLVVIGIVLSERAVLKP